MKIFVLASRFPYPLERGDKLRLFHQLKGLSAYHEIHLFSVVDQRPDEAHVRLMQDFCKTVHFSVVPKWKRAQQFMRALVYGWPMQAAVNFDAGFHKAIIAQAKSVQPDLVFCQLIRMAPYVRGLEIPKHLDFMDAYGIGMRKRGEISRGLLKALYLWESRRTIRYEEKLMDAFHTFSIISEQDAACMPKAADIEIVSNGIDFEHFSNELDRTAGYDVGFIGNMGYLPNIEAVLFLCKKVIPVLEQTTKRKIRVLIAGARPDNRVLSLNSDSVRVTGWVEDIRDMYLDCKVLCAPLFNGTGQQNKILEAMALGIPCVTTPEVNQAIGAKENHEILVARNASDFSQALAQLLEDEIKRKSMGENGRAFVKKHFDWSSTIHKLNTIFAKTIHREVEL